jgi:hypothetical protein
MRWLAGVATAGAVLLLAAGCAKPAGVDGALVDDWTAAPVAEVWKPKAGDCHITTLSIVTDLDQYKPVECSQQHEMEIAHVGEFTGEDATRVTPPAADAPGLRKAYDDCVTKTTEFLGGHWRTGRVWLQVGKPNDKAWEAGARWFRCDLWEFPEDDDTDQTARTGSLRGALADAGPLRFGCFTITEKNDKIEGQAPIACDKPHNGEFAGLYLSKDLPYPKTDAQEWAVLGKGCYGVVATFAGLKNDSTFQRRINFVYTLHGEKQWARGDRSVMCVLYLGKNVTKSMKGSGAAAYSS